MIKLNTYSKWCQDEIKDGFKALMNVCSASSESSISMQQSGLLPYRGNITSDCLAALDTELSRKVMPPEH